MGDGQIRHVSIATIQAQTARKFGVPLETMVSRRRYRRIARPRQVAMYLACQLTDHGYSEIGRRFGGRDHTTVMWAKTAVVGLIDDDPDFRAVVMALRIELETAHG